MFILAVSESKSRREKEEQERVSAAALEELAHLLVSSHSDGPATREGIIVSSPCVVRSCLIVRL